MLLEVLEKHFAKATREDITLDAQELQGLGSIFDAIARHYSRGQGNDLVDASDLAPLYAQLAEVFGSRTELFAAKAESSGRSQMIKNWQAEFKSFEGSAINDIDALLETQKSQTSKKINQLADQLREVEAMENESRTFLLSMLS